MNPVQALSRTEHLGDRAAAVADGALPPAELERWLSHVAFCADCRSAVMAERAAKQWVSTLDIPQPDLELLGRLLTISPTRPVAPAKSTLRSLAVLSGAGAAAAAVLFVSITGSTAAGAGNRDDQPLLQPRTTPTAVTWTVPVAVVERPPVVGRTDSSDRVFGAGMPAAFDVAASPGPTPPYATAVSRTVPGVTQ